jgi:hypothetical protein
MAFFVGRHKLQSLGVVILGRVLREPRVPVGHIGPPKKSVLAVSGLGQLSTRLATTLTVQRTVTPLRY